MVELVLYGLALAVCQRNAALFSDNVATVAILHKLDPNSVRLRTLFDRIIRLLSKLNVHLQIHHIQGELKTFAD